MFLLNSRQALLTAASSGFIPPTVGLRPTRGTPSPEVTGRVCRVPWPRLARSPLGITLAHQCRFPVRSPEPLLLRLFLVPRIGPVWLEPPHHLKVIPSGLDPEFQLGAGPSSGVTPGVIARFRWRGNINPLPIDYALRPRLRGRLTLGG